MVVGPDGQFGLSMTEFIGPIVKAVQELDAKVKELEKQTAKGRDGFTEKHYMGLYQVGDSDTVGAGHDLAADVGNIRNAGKAR